MDTRYIIKWTVLLSAVFAVILLNSGCKKQLYHNEVSGTVIDSITGLPLAGAMVSLIEIEPGGSHFYGFSTKTIIEETADSNGKFYFEYKAKRKHEYFYTIYKEGYYKILSGLLEREFFGKKIDNMIYLIPNVYLKIHYKNVQPFDEHDYIRISGWASAYGMNIDDTTQAMVSDYFSKQDFIHKIYWSVTKNSITTEHSGSVYGFPGDTTLFHIYY